MGEQLTADQQIQKDGANARALGQSSIDNPYYVAPSKTGEPQDALTRKADLWELGWRIEDMMR